MADAGRLPERFVCWRSQTASRVNINATLTRLAVSLTLRLGSSDRRRIDQRSRSPKSEGCIIATSGRRPEKVIDNTGRTKFWFSRELLKNVQRESTTLAPPRACAAAIWRMLGTLFDLQCSTTPCEIMALTFTTQVLGKNSRSKSLSQSVQNEIEHIEVSQWTGERDIRVLIIQWPREHQVNVSLREPAMRT